MLEEVHGYWKKHRYETRLLSLLVSFSRPHALPYPLPSVQPLNKRKGPLAALQRACPCACLRGRALPVPSSHMPVDAFLRAVWGVNTKEPVVYALLASLLRRIRTRFPLCAPL